MTDENEKIIEIINARKVTKEWIHPKNTLEAIQEARQQGRDEILKLFSNYERTEKEVFLVKIKGVKEGLEHWEKKIGEYSLLPSMKSYSFLELEKVKSWKAPKGINMWGYNFASLDGLIEEIKYGIRMTKIKKNINFKKMLIIELIELKKEAQNKV